MIAPWLCHELQDCLHADEYSGRPPCCRQRRLPQHRVTAKQMTVLLEEVQLRAMGSHPMLMKNAQKDVSEGYRGV
jgi:hypothetical protein